MGYILHNHVRCTTSVLNRVSLLIVQAATQPTVILMTMLCTYRLTPGSEAVPDIPEAVYSTARGFLSIIIKSARKGMPCWLTIRRPSYRLSVYAALSSPFYVTSVYVRMCTYSTRK